MNKDTKIKVPKLRFSGFDGEWEEKKVIENAIFLDSQRVPLEERERAKRKGKYPYYGASGIIDHIDDFIFDGEYILLGEDGANIISRSTRLAFLVRGKFWVNNHAHIFRSRTSNYFLCESLERINFSKYNTGTAQPKLNAEVLKNIKLYFPPLPEQQKISSFLFEVDEKIEKIKERKNFLESYKKGVMQKIFSQEIRFKDENGEEFGEWEEKRLGDLVKITTGKLDANAMVENGKYRFYTCAKDYFRIDNFAFDTEALLISGNGANVGYIHYYKGKFNAYQRTYVLDGFKESIFYIKYFLDHFLKRRIISEVKEGNTPYIVLSTLSEMKINLPNLLEQQKIADFLSGIDEKIEKVNEELKESESFKKGLLQSLFV